jgi:hypothetical protein
VFTLWPYVWQLNPGHTYDEHLIFYLKTWCDIGLWERSCFASWSVATLTMGHRSWGNYQRWANSTLISRARCLGRRSPSSCPESRAISSKYGESLQQASQTTSLPERWTCTHSSMSHHRHTQDERKVQAKKWSTIYYWTSLRWWRVSARGSSRYAPHASY